MAVDTSSACTCSHAAKTNGSTAKVSENGHSTKSDDTKAKVDVEEQEKKEEKTEEKKEEKTYAPTGTITASTDIYQGPEDDQGRATWIDKMPDDVAEAAENEETAQYAVVVRKKKCFDSRKQFEIDSLVIQSPALKLALAQVLSDYPGVVCSLNRLIFEAPFEPFVHRWADMLAFSEAAHDDQTRAHFKLLLDILKDELKDSIKAFDDYIAHGIIDFKNLWAIFQPGSMVYSSAYGIVPRLVRFERGEYRKLDCGMAYSLSCRDVDWDGTRFGYGDETVDLFEFKGLRAITQLRGFPLSFHPNEDTVRKTLAQRGVDFQNLAGANYRMYNGMAIGKDNDGNDIKVEVSGRIVIDSASWNKFSPYAVRRVDAIPNSELISEDGQGGGGDDAPNGCGAGGDELELELELGDFMSNRSKPRLRLTDQQLLMCHPKVRGYSLKTKKWLEFFVHLVKDIEWNDDAFSSLVLPDDQKELILTFVESQFENRSAFDDVIQGKGRGCIILLAGPPGTGKTLSCESTAEVMKVPCYALSAGELGDNAWDVERRLSSVLEMVQSWQAVLLIDECDVFLEARSKNDIARNALVSVFLRLLEYFEGILFMTTNRADNLDQAFQSRIHVSVTYPELDRASRRQIWANFLARSTQPHAIGEADLEELAEVELNGRQIKNLLKTAQLLASRKKSELKRVHLETVLAVERRRM
jgi:hypothetical protein